MSETTAKLAKADNHRELPFALSGKGGLSKESYGGSGERRDKKNEEADIKDGVVVNHAFKNAKTKKERREAMKLASDAALDSKMRWYNL